MWFLPLLLTLPQAPQPPAPPVLVGLDSANLPPTLLAPLDRLRKAGDWAGVARYIETLPPPVQATLFATYIGALERGGDPERMLEACTKKIPALDGPRGPSFSVARVGRAKALTRLKRHREAVADYLVLGSLGWVDGDANALAEAHQAEDPGFLIATAEVVLARRPGDPEATMRKGEALARQGRFAEAEPFLLVAVEKFPDRAAPRADLAACQHERGAVPEAFETATKAVALDGKLLEARYNRIRAAVVLQRYAEAKADLEVALTLQPIEPLATNLRILLEQTDKYLEGQARKAAKAASQATPKRRS
jgi:hypothetical protein